MTLRTLLRSRIFNGTFVVLVLGLLAWRAWPQVSAALGTARTGSPAPALSVRTLRGDTLSLAGLKGKVVLVNFWATWCPPCRAEMPALDAFYRQYHGQGLEMIGISTDRPRDRNDVVKVMQAFVYPAAMLGDAKTNGFGAPETLPITYVIDQAGIVRAKFRPDQMAVTQAGLIAAVQPLLLHK